MYFKAYCAKTFNLFWSVVWFYTRVQGGNEKITSAEAIKRGIAPDGGLYVPCKFHKLNLKEIKDLVDMTYPERAVAILRHFLDDFLKKSLLIVSTVHIHINLHTKKSHLLSN